MTKTEKDKDWKGHEQMAIERKTIKWENENEQIF